MSEAVGVEKVAPGAVLRINASAADLLVLGHQNHDGGSWRTRAREWYGWSPLGGAPCPRRVDGRRCRRGYVTSATDPCLCQRLDSLRVVDHVGLWRDHQGRVLWTTELYGRTPQGEGPVPDAMSAARLLEQHGLRLEQYPVSPWYPSACVLLVVSAGAARREP